MCPFCFSSVLTIAASTASVGGVAALVAFARKLALSAEPSNHIHRNDDEHE